MLRVSTQISGEKVDIRGIVDGGAAADDMSIEQSLLHYAESALGEDLQVIADARQSVKDLLGEQAMVDAAGVIANFQRMVRIADGTGIPLDAPVAMMTADIRADLGLNDYGSADNTPPVAWPKRILARILRPMMPFIMKRMVRDVATDSETTRH